METLENLTLYFYIACGITLTCLLLLFALVGILYIKVRRLTKDGRSNQLGHQTNMMADFCYSNPTIVPGEELSRRGFSMYSSNYANFPDDREFKNKYNGGTYLEARSKF